MLFMNNIFERTWGHRAGTRPAADYWPEVIGAVRAAHPDFRFVAEAYWDLEWELQQQGFAYCYDKRLYDRLEHDSAEMMRLHLLADLAYQEKLIRFIENHDEPRAAATFFPDKHRAAAVTTMTQLGAKLLHEGQFEGRKVRLPVFLGRRPDELPDPDLQAFYTKLLKVTKATAFREGDWQLCERTGWSDNASFLNLVAWCWRKEEERWLIIVNLSNKTSQALVHMPWDDLRGRAWRLVDVMAGVEHKRNGNEMRDQGFFVDLGPWTFHFFHVLP
jgi:hypothetical protein